MSANKPINSHGVEVSITELLEIKIWGYHRAGNGELRLSKAGLLWSEEKERPGSAPGRWTAEVGLAGRRGLEQDRRQLLLTC